MWLGTDRRPETGFPVARPRSGKVRCPGPPSGKLDPPFPGPAKPCAICAVGRAAPRTIPIDFGVDP